MQNTFSDCMSRSILITVKIHIISAYGESKVQPGWTSGQGVKMGKHCCGFKP